MRESSVGRATSAMVIAVLAGVLCLATCHAQDGYWKFRGSHLEKCQEDQKVDYCTAAGGRSALRFTWTTLDGGGNAYIGTAVFRWEIAGRLDALVPEETLSFKGTLTHRYSVEQYNVGAAASISWELPGTPLWGGGSFPGGMPFVEASRGAVDGAGTFTAPVGQLGDKRCLRFLVAQGQHQGAVMFDYEWTEGPVPAEAPLPNSMPAMLPSATETPCRLRVLRGSATVAFANRNTKALDMYLSRDPQPRVEAPVDATSTLELEPGLEASFFVGDSVTTGPETRVELIFPDGWRFVIKSNSRVYNAGENILVEAGGAWFQLRHWGGTRGTFNVVTPTSCTGCLGTTFTVEVADDGTTICAVGDGAVSFSDIKKSKTVTITTGQWSMCAVGGTPTDPQPYDAAIRDRLFGEDPEKGELVPVVQPPAEFLPPPPDATQTQ